VLVTLIDRGVWDKITHMSERFSVLVRLTPTRTLEQR
jgi:hypothetical protein